MATTIIGLDPGLASVGYGIIRVAGNKSLYLAHGVITTATSLGFGERLLALYHQLKKILDNYKPDEAGVEDIYFARNSKTYAQVAQAKGIILLVLAEEKIHVGEYSPLVIKRALAGNGKAEKSQIQELVRLLLGLKERPAPDHAADALAAALCHAQQAVFNKIVQKAGRKCV